MHQTHTRTIHGEHPMLLKDLRIAVLDEEAGMSELRDLHAGHPTTGGATCQRRTLGTGPRE